MTVSGINNLPNPWFLQQARQAAASSTNVAATTGTATGGQTTPGAGAPASDAAFTQFSAMIEAMVTQLQSDTGGAMSTTAPAAAGATAGQPAANATASGTTSAAISGQTATAANTTSDGQNGQVKGQYHGHHHHHHGGGADETQSLSATNQTALQTDADNLVNALFGAPSNANAAGTATTAGTTATLAAADTAATTSTSTAATGASTAAASATTAQPAGSPPQTIAAVFAQDMLNAIEAYTAQNPTGAAGITPALNAIA